MASTPHHTQVPKLLTGQTVCDLSGDRYSIISQAGTGGLGHVYRAKTANRRDVAIKLPLVFHHGADVLGETRWTYQRSIPNVVPVLAIGSHSFKKFGDCPVPFMVMPYFRDTIATDCGQHGPYPIGTAITWIAQVATALRSLAIIHRDLKLENLFLDRQRSIHVGDFGLAIPESADLRERCGLDIDGNPCGTPDYMAPEQLAADRNIDCRTDIFALGMILFELVTCHIARDTADQPIGGIIKDLRQNGFGPKNMHLITDQAIATIVSTCCQRSRRDRYQSHDDLLEALAPHRDRHDAFAITRTAVS